MAPRRSGQSRKHSTEGNGGNGGGPKGGDFNAEARRARRREGKVLTTDDTEFTDGKKAGRGVQPRKMRTTRKRFIRGDRLSKYIVDSKFGKRLSAEEVDAVARAFSSLARMDPDFCARADVVAVAKGATADVGALGEPVRALKVRRCLNDQAGNEIGSNR